MQKRMDKLENERCDAKKNEKESLESTHGINLRRRLLKWNFDFRRSLPRILASNRGDAFARAPNVKYSALYCSKLFPIGCQLKFHSATKVLEELVCLLNERKKINKNE